MARDVSYNSIMARKNTIMRNSVGLDYSEFELSSIAFDYEGLMETVGLSLEEVSKIQRETNVGNTPLVELRNVTRLVRKLSPKGKGARIFAKDEAASPSGSFKDRRASISVYYAEKRGYEGVIAATSGNYGAAVAAQAAKRGLSCIIIQEAFDSRGVGQPEILEKARKCEAYGAEVLQLSVGPELFYCLLRLLEETGYFNASLYTPFSVAGIETLGYEIAREIRESEGCDPDAVLITHAGGGNVTGTARGLLKAGCGKTEIVAVSVDLWGLQMASDTDFNRKSFTTGHTGFGIPFATWPDRVDTPRNAARALRYMDRYVIVTQGEVFYVTEILAKLEGLERGLAGNTSLAAATHIAQGMDEDKILVVNETEYSGAGKHPYSQITFARQNGIEVKRGDPVDNVPGKTIVIPEHPSQIKVKDIDLKRIKESYIRNAVADRESITVQEILFLAEDTKSDTNLIKEMLRKLNVNIPD